MRKMWRKTERSSRSRSMRKTRMRTAACRKLGGKLEEAAGTAASGTRGADRKGARADETTEERRIQQPQRINKGEARTGTAGAAATP